MFKVFLLWPSLAAHHEELFLAVHGVQNGNQCEVTRKVVEAVVL